MTNSDIPRSLFYKDIENISNVIGSSSKPSLEREFYERLIKRPFMKDASDPQRCVYTVFNNARYIIYLINIEEDSPCLCFNTYLAKAADYTGESETRAHITAATMALVYNWLSHRLQMNRQYMTEFKRDSCMYFNEREEADIKELSEKIYLHFSDEKNEVTDGCNYDFHTLLMKKSSLPTNLDALLEDLREISDAAANAPIQDVAIGIDYILDGSDIENETNGDCYLFLNKILKRFEKEKSLVKDLEILEYAKVQIERRLQQLDSAPQPQSAHYDLGYMATSQEMKEKFGDYDIISPEIKNHIGWIINKSKAAKILKILYQHMEGKTKPRDVLMPLCAAFDAGVIRKPTFNEYKIVFKNHPVKSQDSYSFWVCATAAKKYEKTNKGYSDLKELFKED